MAIHGSNTTGLSVRANTNNISAAGKWLKIARFEAASSQTNDSCVSTFLVNITGNETVSSVQSDISLLITAKHTSKGSSPYYYATGTNIHVETLVANDLDTWAASTHLAMLVNRASMDFSAEVWIKTPNTSNKTVYVTHLGNSHNSVSTNFGFTLIDGAQTTNNHADSLPASIQSSSGAGVAVDTIVGTDSDKVVGNLTVNSKIGVGTSDPKKELVIKGDDAVIRIGANVNSDGNDMSGRVEIAEDANNDGEMTHGGFLEFDGDAAAGSGSGQLILGVRNNSTSDVDIVKIDRDAPANSILITDSGVTLENLGNAATATALETARSINGVSFNGTANITVDPYVEDDDSSNAARHLVFVDNSTAGYRRLNQDASLQYNPSTNTLTATTFSGNATSATTSTNANNVAVTNDVATNADHYITFVGHYSGNQAINVDNAVLKFNPGTNVLTTGHIRPLSDDGYDIGTSTLAFQDCYLEGNLYFTDSTEIDVASGDLTLDVAGDINLDAAGDQIRFKDAGSSRIVFNLDSTPEMVVTGNFILDGSGTIEIDSASSILLDAATDITLSADGDQIRMDDGTNTRFTFNVDSTPQLDVAGNFILGGSGTITLDAAGDITLDAAGDQISFKDNGTERIVFNLDDTPEMDVTGTFTIDCSNNITLNADGGTIFFKDASANLGTITSTGYSGNSATATTLKTARNIGGVSFNGSASITPQNIDITTDSGNASHYVAFFDATTGARRPKTDGGLYYNPSTNRLTTTTFSGALSGNATTATTLATTRQIGGVNFNGSASITPQNISITTDSGNATHYVPFFDSTTGAQRPKTDSALKYNPSTNKLTAGRMDTNFINADDNFMIDSDSTGNRHVNFKLTEGSMGMQLMCGTGQATGAWVALMEVAPANRTSYWGSEDTFGAVMQYDASANYLKFTGRNGTSGTNMVYWVRDTGDMNIYGKFLFRNAPPDQNNAAGGSGTKWDLQMKASSSNNAPFTIVYINSTKKVKTDIVSIDRADSLAKLKKLRPVTYTHRSDKQEDMGFVAEEVYEVDPILSCMDADYKYDENGEKIVKEKTEDGPVYELESDNTVPGGYSSRNVTTLTVSALQALIDRVEQLELEVLRLKGQ